jgi:hypothetical protein
MLSMVFGRSCLSLVVIIHGNARLLGSVRTRLIKNLRQAKKNKTTGPILRFVLPVCGVVVVSRKRKRMSTSETDTQRGCN